MSRIGKLPIKLGDKVKANIAGNQINFDGPKGKLSVKLPELIKVEVKDGHLNVVRADDSRQARALHGLTRTIVANANKGVSTGWERRLDIRGVGYRAEVKGKTIQFSLGFSHPIVFPLPEGVTAEMDKAPRTEDGLPTIGLTLRSANKEALGETAVKIRALRPPEPYKGKGIKYATERVRRKEGKTGTA
jgi:large subunit ribosomal protein L6